MSPQLDAIWQQIQNLDEADQLTLSQRLDALKEAQSGSYGNANEKQPIAGWRALYGAGDPTEVAELQRIVDAEFSTADSEGWD
jgi:hypothetical protein